jgi:hypothetical protein
MLMFFWGANEAIVAQTSPRLSKTQILAMTRVANRKPKARTVALNAVIKAVRQDGVDFELTKSDEHELRAAGATPALIAAVRRGYRATDEGAENTPRSPKVESRTTSSNQGASRHQPSRSYEELLNLAKLEIEARNFSNSVEFLRQAIRQDATKAPAYALLAYVQYVHLDEPQAAAQAMHRTLEKGGSVRFPLRHFHFNHIGCEGILVISLANVWFETNHSNDRFTVSKSDIYENRVENYGLHLRLRKPDGGQRNFDFATQSRRETELLVELINKKY